MEKGLKRIFVIAGPSGAGKGTIINELLLKSDQYCVAISHTSRKPRAGEKEGEHYYFIDKSEFEKKTSENFFLEHELVHENYYGTSFKEIDRLSKLDKVILFDIDVRGALSIRKEFPEAVLVFLNAPSKKVLVERINNRESETAESLAKRLQTMENELKLVKDFDYQVINDKLDKTVDEISEIIIKRSKK